MPYKNFRLSQGFTFFLYIEGQGRWTLTKFFFGGGDFMDINYPDLWHSANARFVVARHASPLRDG